MAAPNPVLGRNLCLIRCHRHRFPPQSFPVLKTKTVPPAKAHPASCQAYHLLCMIIPEHSTIRCHRQRIFCRIRFLPISVWRFASLNEPNRNAQKEFSIPAKCPAFMNDERYEIPMPTFNKKNAGWRPHFFTSILRKQTFMVKLAGLVPRPPNLTKGIQRLFF